MRTKQDYQEAFNDIVDNGISCEYFNIKTELKQTDNPIFIIQELIDNSDKQYEKGMSDGLDMVISIVQQLRVRK